MSSAGLTRALSAPRLHRERLRARHVREAILSVTALAVLFGIGVLLFKTPAEPPSARLVRSFDTETTTATATIRLSQGRDEQCRQLVFDNRTGSIQDAGAMFCGAASEPPPKTAVGGAISGNHLGRIRDSFRR
jgi:hypothetical protein